MSCSTVESVEKRMDANVVAVEGRIGRGQVARIYGCHDAVTMGRAGIRGDGVV